VAGVRSARGLIGDAHGLTLIVDPVSRENIQQVRDYLITAIRDEKIQVLEIKNHKGASEMATPYFTKLDLDLIQGSMDAVRYSLSGMKDCPPKMRIAEDTIKASGYTAVHVKLRLRNPKTRNYDMPPCELQIRGRAVDEFYEAEHLVHDIRVGKDLFKNNAAVRAEFEPQVGPLRNAIETMSERQFEQFTQYLSAYYLYCLEIEKGLKPEKPQLPAALPRMCGIDELKRLSQLQRNLLQKYPV
jgi:hypothetical protein